MVSPGLCRHWSLQYGADNRTEQVGAAVRRRWCHDDPSLLSGPAQEGSHGSFPAVRAALDIDIMIYNNPWFAGYQLEPTEAETLYKEGVVQSIKVAHGDLVCAISSKFHTGDDFTVFYGHDYGGAESLLMMGADGWLSAWPAFSRSIAGQSMMQRTTKETQISAWNS